MMIIDTFIMTIFCMIAIYLIYIDYNQISEAIKVAKTDEQVTAIDLSGFDRGYWKW